MVLLSTTKLQLQLKCFQLDRQFFSMVTARGKEKRVWASVGSVLAPIQQCSCFKCVQSLGTHSLFLLPFSLSLSLSFSPRLSRVNRQNFVSANCSMFNVWCTIEMKKKKRKGRLGLPEFQSPTDSLSFSLADSSFFCMKRRRKIECGKGHVLKVRNRRIFFSVSEMAQKCQFVCGW